MYTISITFSTSENTKVFWTDSYKGFETDELKGLIIECRGALHSLEAELSNRQDPQVDNTLESCYNQVQQTASEINRFGELNIKENLPLDDAKLVIEELRDERVDLSQTHRDQIPRNRFHSDQTRRDDMVYGQFLWLIAKAAGPAYALLIICSLKRRKVQRLKSTQSARLIKYVTQHRNSLFCSVLQNKAEEIGFHQRSTHLCLILLPLLTYADANLNCPLEMASRKRRRGESADTDCSPSRVEFVVNSHNEGAHRTHARSRQAERKSNEPATLLNLYGPSESDEVTSSEASFSSGVLTPVSEAAAIDDKYSNSNLPDDDIGCSAVVEPQNQVVAFHPPSPLFHDRQPNRNGTSTEEGVLTTPRARPHIGGEKRHDADSSLPILNSKLNPMADDGGTKDNSLLVASRPRFPSVSALAGHITSTSLPITLGDVEKIVYSLSTDCPSDKDYLLLLFYALGGSHIPYILFERAQSAQGRWTKCGDKGHVTALEAGLDQQLVDLLSDDAQLTQALQQLDPVIKTDHEMSMYSFEDGLQHKLSQFLSSHVQEEWSLKALKLITFVFPRDQFFEPLYVASLSGLNMTPAKSDC